MSSSPCFFRCSSGSNLIWPTDSYMCKVQTTDLGVSEWSDLVICTCIVRLFCSWQKCEAEHFCLGWMSILWSTTGGLLWNETLCFPALESQSQIFTFLILKLHFHFLQLWFCGLQIDETECTQRHSKWISALNWIISTVHTSHSSFFVAKFLSMQKRGLRPSDFKVVFETHFQ